MSPIIGLTTYGYLEKHTISPYYDHHYAIPKEYVDAVVQAGGTPLLIPPTNIDWQTLWPVLHGIVVTGGTDVAPQFYNGDIDNSAISSKAPERDADEIALIRYAVATKDKPILCICRGMQVLNVALGGTMHAHIPYIRDIDIHRDEDAIWTTHDCYVEPGSQLAQIMGAETVNTYSGHHQAVNRVADGLQVVATAPDGIIEALALHDHPWLTAVQWHPEKSAANDPSQQRLFDELVKVAMKVFQV